MSTILAALIISGALFGAVWLGMLLRRLLPDHHLSADTKDAVKLAMGLVATMAALLLGLLVSSAKGTYDAERNQVIQLAAKLAVLDRVLELYGPEAADVRAQLRAVVEEAVRRIWSQARSVPLSKLADPRSGDAVYIAIQHLNPQSESQRTLKLQAVNLGMEIGQLRALLVAQSVASISVPLLVVVVSWLVVIFFSFSLLAPPNATAALALVVSAFSVASAIFLILELDRPFGGLIQISSEPLLNALSLFAK
jgi:hypothetical protein